MDTLRIRELMGIKEICPTPSIWSEMLRELGPVLNDYYAVQVERERLSGQLRQLLEAAIMFGSYAKAAKTHNTPEYMEMYWELFRAFEVVIDRTAKDTACDLMRDLAAAGN